jgi:hypothetical protein
VSDCHGRREVRWITAIHKDFGLDESSAGYLLDGVVRQHCVVVGPDRVSIVRYKHLSLEPCVPSDEIVNVPAGRCELAVVSTVRAVVVRYAGVEVVAVLSVYRSAKVVITIE